MICAQSHTDQLVIDWADKHGFDAKYEPTPGGMGFGLTVRLSNAIARFRGGTIDEIHYDNEGSDPAHLVDDMARLFALCAYLEMMDEIDLNALLGSSADLEVRADADRVSRSEAGRAASTRCNVSAGLRLGLVG